MIAFILVIHVIACACLIGIILIQQGKGGGLVSGLSGVESMFGTKTSAFLTRATSIFAVTFLITCLSLAVLSARRNKSVMEKIKITTPSVATPVVNATTTAPTVNATEQPAPVAAPVVPQAPAVSESTVNATTK